MNRVILLLFVATSGFGQSFKGEATISATEADGFYRIPLSPRVTRHLNSDFSNIRIIKSSGGEVPFILQEEFPVQYTEEFRSYEIVEQKITRKCCTHLLLHNPYDQPINNIHLSIKNADVVKTLTVLGSDDKENWFALREDLLLSPVRNPDQTYQIKIIDFPLSNYSYYRIEIDDSTSAPLNILGAGYYKAYAESKETFTEVPVHPFVTDSVDQKRTFIEMRFDTAQYLDKLEITMTGFPYFLRRANLLQKKYRTTKKGDTVSYYNNLLSFQVSSKQSSVIDLKKLKASQLLLEIENDDNPSLQLGSLHTYQMNRYLTAWLKKDEHYTLSIGADDLASPVYDIGSFQDKIPSSPPLLSVAAVKIFQEAEPEPSKTFFTNPMIIWGAIVLVIAVLGFMTRRMISETAGDEHKS